jgi:hypothetical protein
MHKPKHTTLVTLLALAGLLALPMPLHAAGTIVYVDAGTSGVGNGNSWVDAYPSLQTAFTNANPATGDTVEIWVAAGRYIPGPAGNRAATFQLKDRVAIYGGFAGNEAQRDQRDWQTNVTTLSGDLNGDDQQPRPGEHARSQHHRRAGGHLHPQHQLGRHARLSSVFGLGDPDGGQPRSGGQRRRLVHAQRQRAGQLRLHRPRGRRQVQLELRLQGPAAADQQRQVAGQGQFDQLLQDLDRPGRGSGTGDLYWWDASLNGGLGDWVLAQSGVSYTITFYDSGTSGKSPTDTFGIRIVYTPVAPQPNTLPNSTPQLLKGGDIKVS